jgi:hypothetical protein
MADRDTIKNRIKASSPHPGKWSAIKSMMLAKECKKEGCSLDKNSKASKKSGQKGRFRPKKVWDSLDSKEKDSLNNSKYKGTKSGKQFVPIPKKLRSKVQPTSFSFRYAEILNFSRTVGAKDKKPRKRIEYHGKTFAAYNTPVPSDRAGKKKMVLVKQGDTIKLLHYGATGYKNNYSAKAKKNYLARSGGIRNKSGELTSKDKFSPNYWSRKDLWPRNKKGW